MTELKNSDIRKIIDESIGLNSQSDEEVDVLSEAFVAQPKQFKLNTERLSQQTKEAHVELYKEYVNDFNSVSAKLDTAKRNGASQNDSEFASLKRDEVRNGNAIYLHELYFANIGSPASELYSDSLAHMRLDRDFGGFQRWQQDFIACALSAREGWVMTCFNAHLKRYVNVVIDDHNCGVPVGAFPVIVLDVWSHAYYNDNLNNRKKYIANMMREFNWQVIENRFIRAERIADALK